jgi:hypothetical protein
MSETCGVFCNVVRLDPCPDCRLWRSYCLTHLRPTDANRCTCVRAPSPSAAPAHELWDGLFRDEIQCPHCHAVDYEHTDYPSGLRHDGDTAESGCAFCDKPMRVTLCAAYTYATEPLPAPASPRPEESEKTECPHGIDTLKTCGACPDAAPSPGATTPPAADLDALEQLERESREWCGPTWEVRDPPDPDGGDEPWLATPDDDEDGSSTIVAQGMVTEDAQLAAAMRNALPAILAELRSLRRLRADEEGRERVIEAARRLNAFVDFSESNLDTDGNWIFDPPYDPLPMDAAWLALGAALAAMRAPSPSLPEAPPPTHRCKVCGALWRQWGGPAVGKVYWTLVSSAAGTCCDNAPMGDQMEPITEFHRHERLSECEQNAIEFRAGCAPLPDGRDATREACDRCGSSATWVACDFCGGDGFDGHDCGEDSCCCADPEDNVPCGSCSGKGGWSMCLADEEWCKTHPLPAPRATDDNGTEG